jgi:predicted DNA-binding transcriptional regulator YafY
MEIDMTDPYKFKRRHRTTVSTMLMLAIADKVQADLMVRKPDEVQTRRVSVAELQFTPPSDRVLCWDHAKNGYRTFKIADIVGGGLVNEPARPEPPRNEGDTADIPRTVLYPTD